jgi:hypothetical protein
MVRQTLFDTSFDFLGALEVDKLPKVTGIVDLRGRRSPGELPDPRQSFNDSEEACMSRGQKVVAESAARSCSVSCAASLAGDRIQKSTIKQRRAIESSWDWLLGR